METVQAMRVFQTHHKDIIQHQDKLPQNLQEQFYKKVPSTIQITYNQKERRVLIACNNYLIRYGHITHKGLAFTHVKRAPMAIEQLFNH